MRMHLVLAAVSSDSRGMKAEPRFPSDPFTARHSAALGITPYQLRRAVDDGSVRRALRGGYVRADVPDTQQTRIAVAKLVIGPTSVARDRLAAWLHDIDVLEYDELVRLPPLETCVLRGHE
ncbi:MAG: hypothetical protein ACRDPB_06365, partial [Nocardioidaceae bacterium]